MTQTETYSSNHSGLLKNLCCVLGGMVLGASLLGTYISLRQRNYTNPPIKQTQRIQTPSELERTAKEETPRIQDNQTRKKSDLYKNLEDYLPTKKELDTSGLKLADLDGPGWREDWAIKTNPNEEIIKDSDRKEIGRILLGLYHPEKGGYENEIQWCKDNSPKLIANHIVYIEVMDFISKEKMNSEVNERIKYIDKKNSGEKVATIIQLDKNKAILIYAYKSAHEETRQLITNYRQRKGITRMYSKGVEP